MTDNMSGKAPNLDDILKAASVLHPEAMPPEDYKKTLELPNIMDFFWQIMSYFLLVVAILWFIFSLFIPIRDAYAADNSWYLLMGIPYCFLGGFSSAVILRSRQGMINWRRVVEYRRMYDAYQAHIKEHHS